MSLYDKRTDLGDMNDIWLFYEKDVKDFVKELKEYFKKREVSNFDEVYSKIDEIFGKELTE